MVKIKLTKKDIENKVGERIKLDSKDKNELKEYQFCFFMEDSTGKFRGFLHGDLLTAAKTEKKPLKCKIILSKNKYDFSSLEESYGVERLKRSDEIGAFSYELIKEDNKADSKKGDIQICFNTIRYVVPNKTAKETIKRAKQTLTDKLSNFKGYKIKGSMLSMTSLGKINGR